MTYRSAGARMEDPNLVQTFENEKAKATFESNEDTLEKAQNCFRKRTLSKAKS